MALKIIPAAATLFVLAAGPALAQSMFEQMPTIPGEAPAGGAPAAAPATEPTAPMMPAAAAAPPLGVPPAQSIAPQQGGADCNGIQKTLLDRKNLVTKINAGSKQKMTAQQACALFGQLQANGTAGIKWIASNKEWCAIPDSFTEGFKADHAKVSGMRGKICGMATQHSKMEAQAREGGGGGLLGGPGLSGSFKLPQGAL